MADFRAIGQLEIGFDRLRQLHSRHFRSLRKTRNRQSAVENTKYGVLP